MTLLIISFVAGVLTVLAPCILPLLPVIVGRSLSDATVSRRRVFVVIVSLGVSVVLFTLLLKATSLFIAIPQDFWKWISGGIIFIFGLVMIFPKLWEQLSFTSSLSRKSNLVLMEGYKKDSIWGDIIVGASLGPIFSACSPTYFVILATVLPVSPVVGILYLLTYTLGLCLALLFVVLVGQKIMIRLNVVSDSHGWFKRILGIIFILVGIAIITGYDKKLQISLLDAGFFDVTKVEQKLLEQQGSNNNLPNQETPPQAIDISKNNPDKTAPIKKADNFLTLAQKKAKFLLAPDISTPDGFVNTDGTPVTISEFKGKKVVLLDIWTYSCINCQRTIPYLNDWYKKYKDQGLVIIGLHTPEFSFEKVQANVEEAVKNLSIKYPVVLDNDFSTWNAYNNQYWPREYLIDIDGFIVHDHAGEGAYDESELAIQTALSERNNRLSIATSMSTGVVNPQNKIAIDPNQVSSPETYFGSARNEYLANGKAEVPGSQTLTIPADIKPNQLYLGGTWSFNSEYAEAGVGSSIVYNYTAKNVYIVASSAQSAEVEVYLDGKLVDTISIKSNTLYPAVKGKDYTQHTLMLKVKSGILDAFTFTFG